MKYFILDEHGTPEHEPDLARWAVWYEEADTIVGVFKTNDSVVVTKFLGTTEDNDDPPHLWKTSIIGGKLDSVADKCTGGREQAEAMHAKMCQRVQNLKQPIL